MDTKFVGEESSVQLYLFFEQFITRENGSKNGLNLGKHIKSIIDQTPYCGVITNTFNPHIARENGVDKNYWRSTGDERGVLIANQNFSTVFLFSPFEFLQNVKE